MKEGDGMRDGGGRLEFIRGLCRFCEVQRLKGGCGSAGKGGVLLIGERGSEAQRVMWECGSAGNGGVWLSGKGGSAAEGGLVERGAGGNGREWPSG